MNYNIKEKFTALDLQLDDLIYDAQDDTMMRVAMIGPIITKKVEETKLSPITGYTTVKVDLQIRQIVLENVETKELYMLKVRGKDGELPKLENNQPRFRHLVKATPDQGYTITYPAYPYYPYYPYYPCYPTNPYYPSITYTNTLASSGYATTAPANSGLATTQGSVSWIAPATSITTNITGATYTTTSGTLTADNTISTNTCCGSTATQCGSSGWTLNVDGAADNSSDSAVYISINKYLNGLK